MDTKDKINTTNEERLFSGVLWLNTKILGLSLGLLCGLVIFIATNWLVIKGGKVVGPHLQLLSQYFIGYRVSFFGSLIGFAYGFAVGTFSGSLIGWIYNRITTFRN
jgi:tetrahydromethanopterin S-methyltransferase subunit F